MAIYEPGQINFNEFIFEYVTAAEILKNCLKTEKMIDKGMKKEINKWRDFSIFYCIRLFTFRLQSLFHPIFYIE